MKPKSFKSTEGLLDDGIPDEQDRIEHYTFSVDQLRIDSNEQITIQLSPLPDAEDPFEVFALDDVVALAIDTRPEIVMARVADIKHNEVELVEHKPYQSELGQTPSHPWTSFLKELKKKCGSGHHNKKQKRLHVVRMARAIEAKPESIQLTVRQPDLWDSQDVEDVAEQIRKKVFLEADGESVSLDDFREIFPAEPTVIAADYTPQRAAFEPMTYVINGAELRRDLVGSIETISIPKAVFENAMTFHTGGADPLSLSDPKVSWIVTAYSHDKDYTTHDKRAIKKISVSQDDSTYDFELDVSLEARAPAPFMDNKHLVAISGYKPVADEDYLVAISGYKPVADEDFDLWIGGFDDRTLAIGPDMYEFLSESNDGALPQLHITEPLKPETLSRFEEGHPYFTSVGNTQAVFRVTSVLTDDVKKIATVVFGYEGGRIEQSPYAQQREALIMNRALEAFPAIDEALTLTIEKDMPVVGVGADFDPVLDGADDPGHPDLPQIAAGIDQFLQDEQDEDLSLTEVASWIEENSNLPLKVTGVEHVAQRQAYETSSSVSGGVWVDAWESEDGKYIFVDMPASIENVKSIQHISKLLDDKKTPVSEVKERSLIAELEEMREANLGVIQGGGYANVSIYNGEKAYGVCDNERIWRVLRKKKDGKCIYRIVIKKGAMANRIAYGKHRKCVMYIDRLYRVMDPVF